VKEVNIRTCNSHK